ncbi:unnamed protein product [Brassica oleracea]
MTTPSPSFLVTKSIPEVVAIVANTSTVAEVIDVPRAMKDELLHKESRMTQIQNMRNRTVVGDFAKHLDLDKTLSASKQIEIYSAWISGEKRKKEMMILEEEENEERETERKDDRRYLQEK